MPALRYQVLIPGGTPQAYWYDAPTSASYDAVKLAFQEARPATLFDDPIQEPKELPGERHEKLPAAHSQIKGEKAIEYEIEIGSLAYVPIRSRKVWGLVVDKGEPELDFATKAILELDSEHRRCNPAWIDFLRWLSEYYNTPLPTVYRACVPKSAEQLIFRKKRIAKTPNPKRKSKKKLPDSLLDSDSLQKTSSQPGETVLKLTEEQGNAVQTISVSLQLSEFTTYLLHGVTGSGKTLVYLYLAEQALKMGKNILVLIPEIGLTPQTLTRFRSFLKCEVLSMHSNLPSKEKKQVWDALLKNQVRVLVGARSAVLAPLANIGLIIVDEEHDNSYKQNEAAPRYHARDAAIYRAKSESCPIILGSATPSMESYHSAIKKKFQLLELKLRATGHSQARIHIVDMKEQNDLQGRVPLSIPLREALEACVHKGEQAILFLNRRGYSNRRLCKQCGELQQCPRCILPLTYHKNGEEMRCHWCHYKQSAGAPCYYCHFGEFIQVGVGIEKVEEFLRIHFRSCAIFRMDRDTTSRIGSTEAILDQFKSSAPAILLGTQMVAKGHDFPKVNLVGVIDADTGMGLPDFRAQERAFQLITQVAGRAGRHNSDADVYLQTWRPNNPYLQHAIDCDYVSFFNRELEQREQCVYPPVCRLLLVEMSGKDEELLLYHMGEFGRIFKRYASQVQAEVLGPGLAALKRIDNHFRAQIFAKGKAANQLQWILKQSLNEYNIPPARKIKLRIDMDPVSVL